MIHPPEIGQIVYWHPDCERSANPYAAMVTSIGADSINVNIFDPFSYNLRIKDGVRHLDDPRCKNPATRDSGAWEHTPATQRLHKLEMLVQTMTREVEDFVSALGGPARVG